MAMAVCVIVAVIMPVVVPAVRAVNMLSSGRLGMTMAAVFVMVVMVVMRVAAVVVMARVRGRAVGAAFGFKSFLYRVHDQVHGTQ